MSTDYFFRLEKIRSRIIGNARFPHVHRYNITSYEPLMKLLSEVFPGESRSRLITNALIEKIDRELRNRLKVRRKNLKYNLYLQMDPKM